MSSLDNRIQSLKKAISKASVATLDYLNNTDVGISEAFAAKIEKEVDQLEALAKDAERQARIASQKKIVILYGRFSTGKTTVINALFKSYRVSVPDLPVADEPTTAKPVRFTYGDNLGEGEVRCYLVGEDGTRHPVEDHKAMWSEMISDTGCNVEGVVEIAHPLLESFDIVDLPGTGTAFYEEHEKVVKSRLRDGAAILWVSGGPDEQYPKNTDLTLLKGVVRDGKKRVIPVWNCKQDRCTSLANLPEDKRAEFQKKAAACAANYESQYVHGIASEACVQVWAQEVSLDPEGEAGLSNINALREAIAKAADAAPSPGEVVGESLKQIRDQSINAINVINGIRLDMLECFEGERKAIRSALRQLDDVICDLEDVIYEIGKNTAQKVVDERLRPALGDFIDSEMDIGGVLTTALQEAYKTAGQFELLKANKFPENFKKNIEKAVKQRLDDAMGLADKDGWLKKMLTSASEEFTTTAKRKINLMKRNVEDAGLDIDRAMAEIDAKEDGGFADHFDQIVRVAGDQILKKLGSLSGALAAIIVAAILVLSPKTATPVDVVIAIGGTLVMTLWLSAMKNRMKGRIRLACFECVVHIKDLITSPMSDFLKEEGSFWGRIFEANDMKNKTKLSKKFGQNVSDARVVLKSLDFLEDK